MVVLAAIAPLLSLRFGGYHVRHAGWVVLGLAVWACVQAARGRLSAPRSVAGVATWALVALTGWTVASIWWADASRHDAWVEAVRTAGYAAAFILGGALLANARSYVRFVQLTGAGIALVGVATVIRLVGAEAPLKVFVAGRLDWPVGYAPGTAAMYAVGTMLLLGAACGVQRVWERTGRALDMLVGGLTLGAAGICTALAVLGQSRGTVPALAVAIVAALVATPDRTSWLLRAAPIVMGLLIIRPELAHVYQAQFDLRQAPFTPGADPEAALAAAERAARAAGGAVAVLGLALTVVGALLPPVVEWVQHAVRDRLPERPGASVLGGVGAGVALLTSVVALAAPGPPARARTWVADQWHACRNPVAEVQDPGNASSYFATTGTGRCDYYRVAIGDLRQHPLHGVGAGNFRSTYVLERRTEEEPRVTHSLPMQLLAELGVVGGALGALALACVLLAAWRFVRSGGGRDPVFAGAIAAIAYWVAHASVDWLWQLTAVSLPAVVLSGGLVACISPAQRRVQPEVAAPLAAAAILAVIALVVPVTMADHALRRARDEGLRRDHPAEALAQARDAQRFDPTWAEPAITEGSLLLAAGKREAAAKAGARAARLEPKTWTVQYRSSGLIGLTDTVAGRAAFLRARTLNPRLPATTRTQGTTPGAASSPDSVQGSAAGER